MSEEHERLIAKAQYFFDLMKDKKKHYENIVFGPTASYVEKESIKSRIGELDHLIEEFSQTFITFLYQDDSPM